MRAPQRSRSALARLRDAFVPTDDLGDDERQELLRELGIQVGLLGEFPQPGDLPGLPGLIGWRQTMVGFELADAFGEFEALCQKMDEGGIDVVDAAPQLLQPFDCACSVVSVLIHAPSLAMLEYTCAPRPNGRGAQCSLIVAAPPHLEEEIETQAGWSTGTASVVSGSFNVPALRSARYFFISFLTTGMSM